MKLKINSLLLKDAGIYSIANLLNGALPFLLLPIMTRLLPPQEYGILAMFTVVLGILGAFTGLNAQGAINSRYIDRQHIDFPKYIGASLWILLFSTIAVITLVFILQAPLERITEIRLFWILSAVIICGANFIIQLRLGIWLMARKPALYGALQVSSSIFNIGLSIALVVFVYRSADGRLYAQTITAILFGIVSLLSLRSGGWINMRLNFGYMKEIFSFGLPLVPHILGGFLLASADRFIVNERLGLQAAGIYMVGAQLGMGLAMMADAFNKAFVPWLYKQLQIKAESTKKVIVRGTWAYFGLALLLAAVVATLAPWIIHTFAGAAYNDAVSAFQWIALGQAFGGMYLMVTNYVFFTRKTNLLGWLTLASGLFGIATSWVLIPWMGLAGAGAGFAAGMLAKFLLTWLLAHKVCPMPWFKWRMIIPSAN